ncbi:MAG: hypothetical protein ACPGU5_02510 [Lishizhenia sp.]
MKVRKTQTCVTCCARLIGRKDKVYCSDECKNEHHRLARILSTEIRNDYQSNKMIVRNYIILLGLFRTNAKRIHVHRNHLMRHGFDPKSALQKRTLNGKVYFQINEFLFLENYNGILEIIRLKYSNHVLFEEFVVKWAVEFPDKLDQDYSTNEENITVFFKRIELLKEFILTVKAPEELGVKQRLHHFST